MSLNYNFKMKLVFFFILTVGCLAAGQEASTSKKKLKPYMEVRDDCYGENPKEKYAHPQDVLKNVEITNLKAQTQLRSHVDLIGKVVETVPETTTPKGTTPDDGKADKATAKTTETPDNLATASTAKVDEKINSHSKTTTEQPTKPSYPFRTQPKVVNGLVAGEEDPQQLSYVIGSWPMYMDNSPNIYDLVILILNFVLYRYR
ncbi:uncharacterized protein LOC114355145 isoform X2 [Ostrinia furnacalis]|uniref:uncharacterized protein LOC114355145 isoform X2 n=1 Tax=Ostrinia furnacalis TaxID=93504 RepID=UPI00103D38BC|nr:uncharacterized protein LOC114355145 isoform X2 [Ostrinia furnacalis]